MKSFIIALSFLLSTFSFAREHPCLLYSSADLAVIKAEGTKYRLFNQTLNKAKSDIEKAIQRGIELPPPGEAGGYSHERHKQNYREMQQAGTLFLITGDEKYAVFVKNMLLGYADFYPRLGPHPLSHKQAPGKIFHQMLNENVWLLHASIAFDCIYDWLDDSDRNKIADNVFKKMTDWMVNERADQLDRIHNHGVWAAASLGMAGYVLDDQNLVDIALYGTKKDGKTGFLKKMDLLLSPDGYYTEGPYYIRYALRPFFYFAEAIERNQPELNIYKYRNEILKKTFYATVQTMLPDGAYPSINDASLSMDVRSSGTLLATDICYYRYGADANLLGLAGMQQMIVLDISGLNLARDFDKNPQSIVNWHSVEFRDGFDGTEGGLGILRSGKGLDQSYLLMKYGTHGGGHGHFDQLSLLFYNEGHQVLTDYGYARWINIEPKFGGRYLPENKSYAKQTIAHNTVTVDFSSQNRGKSSEADQYSGLRNFFSADNPDFQVVSAVANDCYPGVKMQRTLFLISDSVFSDPLLLDLYIVNSQNEHTYDYSFHYRGQLMTTNVQYKANTENLYPLGDKNGYQHLWVTASGESSGGLTFTWLDGSKYYTLTSNSGENSEIFLCRIGANDPSFNLRSEPSLIIRTEKKNNVFVSALETHGYFDESKEKSVDPYGKIESVRVLGYDPSQGVVVSISFKDATKWLLMSATQAGAKKELHTVSTGTATWSWTGNSKIEKNK